MNHRKLFELVQRMTMTSSMRKIKLNKADKEKKKGKLLLKRKRQKEETVVHFDTVDELSYRDEGSSEELKLVGSGDAKISSKSKVQSKIENSLGSSEAHIGTDTMSNKSKKAGKNKKKIRLASKKERKLEERKSEVEFEDIYHLSSGDNDCSKGIEMVGSGDAKMSSKSKVQSKIENSIGSSEAHIGTDTISNKSKKAGKSKKKNRLTSKKERKLEESKSEEFEDGIYHLSSGDDDCSKGMKKWLTEYHRSRPGLEILQQRIDECITVLEAQQEQARKEREARAAEGGWTVVVHHKGRKRTTDSESGISVGSVAQVAVVDKMAKKRKKAVALNFYNFQRREAQRNEVMMLQSKFEQDKKRIQQMRAARKFRPY